MLMFGIIDSPRNLGTRCGAETIPLHARGGGLFLAMAGSGRGQLGGGEILGPPARLKGIS